MIKKYAVFCISFLLQSQNFMQAVPLNSHKQLFKTILYRVAQTKKEGFPSFQTLKRRLNIDGDTYEKLRLNAFYNDEFRINQCDVDTNFFHTSNVMKENYHLYQLSDRTIHELQQNIPNYSFGNHEFDQECKLACMYSILGQAKRMQETFKFDDPKIAFELLAMYPLKELYKPYTKVSKIIATHERPWVSFLTAKYNFLYIEE